MTQLPITHVTLYKHGVGFFARRAQINGEEVKLSFRVDDMNDILKSLTAIDWGGGQVLGVDYATPQSREERLAGCSVILQDGRSLRDLLTGLRGRRARLILDQAESIAGVLLGFDEVADRQPLATSLVSLLLDGSTQVQNVPLERIHGVDILDEQGSSDLRFFLETSLSQENYRQVTVRLTPGEHDLAVSYIAPAPTWRVSYRLVLDEQAEPGPRALLLGWGIFDNRLEEDLKGISLSLVAGMPISFVYDLYTPFTPDRPVVKEEARTAAAPVEFAEAAPIQPMMAGAGFGMAMLGDMEEKMKVMSPPPAPASISREALTKTTQVSAAGQSLGELFQYVIATPVTVGRGQSAMVPIVAADLGYRKDLLYNGAKLPAHPVATLRLKNESGLTLERGPVTVLEKVAYLGEAILPFTTTGSEIVVPYAVELGVNVQENSTSSRQTHRLYVKGAYLHFEEWEVRWREYQVNSHLDQPAKVLIEHARTPDYVLFETPEATEHTDEHWRFEVNAPARQEVKLRVGERRLVRRYEQLERQSYDGLQRYLRDGLLDRAVYEQVAGLLKLWEKVSDGRLALKTCDEERQKIYAAQTQIQGNMQALGKEGKEGAMRARYVENLEATEEQLKALAKREADLKTEIERIEQDIKARLEKM